MINIQDKFKNRITLCSSLLSIAIGIFFLTINLKAELLENKYLLFQLCSSIPIFLTAILSYSKAGYRTNYKPWDWLGWFTFTIGYSFIINVISILINIKINHSIAIYFLIVSAIGALIYSITDIVYDRQTLKERILKDSLFLSLLTFLGLFVVLGIY
jgi:hypothetical protein